MTLNDIIGDVEHMIDEDRNTLDELIAELAAIRPALSISRRREKELTDKIKELMNQLGDFTRTIVDPETEKTYEATLSETTRTEYDILSMAQHEPQKVIELALQGGLKGDGTIINALNGKSSAADLARTKYAMPRSSQRLNIDEVK